MTVWGIGCMQWLTVRALWLLGMTALCQLENVLEGI